MIKKVRFYFGISLFFYIFAIQEKVGYSSLAKDKVAYLS